MKMEQSVPKSRNLKFRSREIVQKKPYNRKQHCYPWYRRVEELLNWVERFEKRGNFLFSAKVRNRNVLAKYLMNNKFIFVTGIVGYTDAL